MLPLFASLLIAATPVSAPAMHAFEVALAVSGDRAAVAWFGGRDRDEIVYLQKLTSTGGPDAAPVPITDPQVRALVPDLQLIGEDALLAWYEQDRRTGRMTTWLARIDPKGARVWTQRLDAEGGYARNPVVRVAGGRIAIAWIEKRIEGVPPTVWAQAFDLDGHAERRPVRLGDADDDTWNLNADFDRAGAFYVAYDARHGARAKELQVARLDRSGQVSARALTPNDGTPSLYPDIGFDDRGDVAIAWFEGKEAVGRVKLAVLPAAQLMSAPLPAARNLSRPSSAAYGAYLAWNGNSLSVAWCERRKGRPKLYAELFDRRGRPEGAPKVLASSARHAGIPAIRAWGHRFMVAWNDYELGPGGGHAAVGASTAMTSTFGGKAKPH